MSKITWVPIIALWQPWANLIVTPHDKVGVSPMKMNETRGWSTKFRGRMLVHAAKKVSPDLKAIVKKWPFTEHPQQSQFNPLGAIVGSVEVVDCITSEKWLLENAGNDNIFLEEYKLGDFGPGRFAWKLANPVLFDNPISCIGRQGFWKYPLEVLPEKYQQHFKTK